MSEVTVNFVPLQGWQCPICHRVYSPMTSMCFYCGDHPQAPLDPRFYRRDTTFKGDFETTTEKA